MYPIRLKKYIGAYTAALGGLDALVFTGGIGENDEFVREYCTDGLEWLGIELDKKLNLELNRKEAKISTQNSKVPIYIIPTNEELVIALDTEMIIKGEAVDY
jgi:acetate kinase